MPQRKNSHPFRSQGFSLVELALALAILGLIVGGVLVARTMVRTGELQKGAARMQEMQQHVALFSDRYNSLPGDMPDASSVLNGTNGNGDRRIAHNNGADAEEFRVWQHLRLAGLIQGQYTGVFGTPHQPGITIGDSGLDGSGFRLFYSDGTGTGIYDDIFTVTNLHWLIWARVNSATGYADVPVLSAVESAAMDDKLDDANASSGTMLANGGAATANNCSNASGVYLSGDDEPDCVIYWRMPEL